MIEARGLWALPPEMIAEVVKRQTLAGMLPEALRALAGGSAKAPSDPIRDGATVIHPVEGVLSPRGSYGGTSTTKLADRIREYGDDPKIGAVILNISSPGGLVYGAEEAAQAIYEVRSRKPVAAVANPMAASCAYWLGSQASAFYASTSADVGSIGVYAEHTDQSGFEDKIGFRTTLISAGAKKVLGNSHEPLSEEALAEIQASVDESYQMFLKAVARGRGVSVGDVEKNYGQGAMVSAQRATSAGMIDGVLTLREVVAKYATSRARLSLMRRQAAAMEALHSI